MGKKAKNFFLYSFLLIITIILGYLFFSPLLNKDKIHSHAKDFLHLAFPNKKILIGRPTIHYGLIMRVSFEFLKISEKHSILGPGKGHSLLKTKKITLSYPLISHLNRKKEINISVQAPELRFFKKNKMASKKSQLVNMLREYTINFYAKDLVLKNINHPVFEKNIKITKLILKNINPYLKTSFEIDSPFLLRAFLNEKLNFDGRLIGHFDLKKWIETQELEVQGILNLAKGKLEFLEMQLPPSSLSFNLVENKEGKIKGHLKFILSEKSKISFDIDQSPKITQFKKIKSSIDIEELFKMIGFKAKNLDISNSFLTFDGGLSVYDSTTNKKRYNPHIKFRSNKKITYFWNNIKTDITFDGGLIDQTWALNTKLKLLGGSINSHLIMQKNKMGQTDKKENSFLWSLMAKDLTFNKETLAYFLIKDPLLKNLRSYFVKNSHHNGKINATWNQSKVSNLEFSGKSIFLVGNDKLINESTLLNLGTGNALIKSITMKKDRHLETRLKIKLKKFELSPFIFELSREFPQFSGKISGSIKGRYSSHPSLNSSKSLQPINDFIFFTNLKGKNGYLKHTPLQKKFDKLMESLPKKKGLKDRPRRGLFDSPFNHFHLIASLAPKRYHFKKIKIIGEENLFRLNGSGSIYLEGKKSQKISKLIFTYSEGNKVKQKNEFKKIKFHLIGPGANLQSKMIQ